MSFYLQEWKSLSVVSVSQRKGQNIRRPARSRDSCRVRGSNRPAGPINCSLRLLLFDGSRSVQVPVQEGLQPRRGWRHPAAEVPVGRFLDLGGMLVLAGNDAGLKAWEAEIPPEQGRFPMRLSNHAAFHTALQAPVAERGRARLAPDLFSQPNLPLIDGRGAIWWPGETDTHALWDYTLGHQVTEPYDFTKAIRIAAREFAPDLFVVTGPGTTLGGAVAQSLILANWRGMGSKSDFQTRQQTEPLLIAMGMDDQRSAVTKGD